MRPHVQHAPPPGCTLRTVPRRAVHSGRRGGQTVTVGPALRRPPPRAAMQPARAGGRITDLIALDFDGVVCDSVGESALSAWRVRWHNCRCGVHPQPRLRRADAPPHAQAAEKLWPDVFGTPAAAAQKARVMEEMRTVRPVVETGYENLVQVRLLLEMVPTARPLEMLRRWQCVARGCARRARGARLRARL
jgi:hypothetical protein